jgi:hypothetical protein
MMSEQSPGTRTSLGKRAERTQACDPADPNPVSPKAASVSRESAPTYGQGVGVEVAGSIATAGARRKSHSPHASENTEPLTRARGDQAIMESVSRLVADAPALSSETRIRLAELLSAAQHWRRRA